MGDVGSLSLGGVLGFLAVLCKQELLLIVVGGLYVAETVSVILQVGYFKMTGGKRIFRMSQVVRRLGGLGASIAIGHGRENLGDADVVVKSTAVSADNPEVLAARERGIPVIPRAEMLSELMAGVRLEVRVHIVTGAVTSAQNIIRSCHRAGLDVSDIVLESLASSKAVLTGEEREIGVALVDLGGGTTDLAIFANDSIKHTAVLALGGTNLTNDIAFGLRTPMLDLPNLRAKAIQLRSSRLHDIYDVTARSVVRFAVVVGMIRSGSAGSPAVPTSSPRRKFTHAFAVTASNPKDILFFLAFLPQFVNPTQPANPQLALLGATFVILSAVNATAYSYLSGSAGNRIRNPRFLRRLRAFGGSILVGAGVLTAASGQ